MIRHLIASFFLSFFGVMIMLSLYIWLPLTLTEKVTKKTTPISTALRPAFLIPSPLPTPSPTPSPTPGLIPVTLIIPKLNIQAVVEPVGLTETNNMDVPKNANDAAWYTHGARPSEVGNAVISAHYDTPTGKPALFYNLKTLKPGDTVEIISNNAVKSTFEVTEIDSIPYDKFPSEEVFKTKPGRNLNLITCGGIWDPKKKIYSNRIVVYTTLKP